MGQKLYELLLTLTSAYIQWSIDSFPLINTLGIRKYKFLYLYFNGFQYSTRTLFYQRILAILVCWERDRQQYKCMSIDGWSKFSPKFMASLINETVTFTCDILAILFKATTVS